MNASELDKTCRIVEVRLAQDADCCDGNILQYMTITVADGGGGSYPVLSTERWAIDPANVPSLHSLLAKLCEWYDEAEKAREKKEAAVEGAGDGE